MNDVTQVIEAPSSVTVRNAGDFAGVLLGAVQEGGDIDIDLSDLAEVDLSFVQLLLAARAHVEQEGARFGLAQPAVPALAALLDRAGFLGDLRPADIEFWFHGELPQ
nr:STAS domain-containing protein [Sphingomonas sp. dw_22]